MCEVVRAKVELDTPGPDGATPRDHYDAVERATGKKVYSEPDVPHCAVHLWQWFVDLSGNETLTYAELKAWRDMTGVEPSPFEVSALRAMFRARQEASNAN